MRLNQISDLLKTSWRLLPRDYCKPNNKEPLSLNNIRQILNPSVYQLPLVRTLQSTMTIGKQALQQVTVKRYLKSVKRKQWPRHRFAWNEPKEEDLNENTFSINSKNNYAPEATIFVQGMN